jgi:hypothetical protein
MHESKLTCRECGWEASRSADEFPDNVTQAAIDHYLASGHSIERTDFEGGSGEWN